MIHAYLLVFEAQDRGSLHFHGSFWGAYSPSFFQYSSDKPNLVLHLQSYLDSCIQTFVDDHIHLSKLCEQLNNDNSKEKNKIDENEESSNTKNTIKPYRGSLNVDNPGVTTIIKDDTDLYPETKALYKDIFLSRGFTDVGVENVFEEMSLFDMHVHLSARNCNYHKHSFTCHKG